MSRHASRIDFCLFDEAGSFETLGSPSKRDWAMYIRASSPASSLARGMASVPKARGIRRKAIASIPKSLLADPYAFAFDRAFAHCPELQWPPDRAVDTAPFMPKSIIGEPAASPAPRLGRTGPPGFIYEIAVRAFTRLHPAIPETQRGTVAALAHPAIIEHLTKLGVGRRADAGHARNRRAASAAARPS